LVSSSQKLMPSRMVHAQVHVHVQVEVQVEVEVQICEGEMA